MGCLKLTASHISTWSKQSTVFNIRFIGRGRQDVGSHQCHNHTTIQFCRGELHRTPQLQAPRALEHVNRFLFFPAQIDMERDRTATYRLRQCPLSPHKFFALLTRSHSPPPYPTRQRHHTSRQATYRCFSVRHACGKIQTLLFSEAHRCENQSIIWNTRGKFSSLL